MGDVKKETVGAERLREMLASIPRYANGNVRSAAWVGRVPAPTLEAILSEILALRQPDTRMEGGGEAVAWQARKDIWPAGYWSSPALLAHIPVVDFGEGWETRLLYAARYSPTVEELEEQDGAMTPEEIRLENLKQMAAYSGPIVSFEIREPYYLASCDKCGWVGSSEHCGTDSFGDDSDVYCPRCHASGADCGKVAERLSSAQSSIQRAERERDEALAKWEKADGMDGAVVDAIRQMLNAHNVPLSAFIDDHVANAIRQRNAAEAQLEEARKVLERIKSVVTYPCDNSIQARGYGIRSIDKTGCEYIAESVDAFLASLGEKQDAE